MKNIILFILLMVCSKSFSQMAVIDATANQTMAQQLATAAQQLETTSRNYEMLKKSAEKIEKVSEAIKSVNQIGTFIKMQAEILSNIDRVISSNRNRITSSKLSNVLKNTSTTLDNVKNLLSNSFFSLNDAERLELLEKEKRKIGIELMRSRLYLNSTK